MQHERIKMSEIVLNEGQIHGVPANPRTWTKSEISRLKRSIEETPELLDARGLIVYPYGGCYVVLGGNLRYSALKMMKAKDAPCIVIPEDTASEKLRQIVIKDNGAFGNWDYDALANEWNDEPLTEWGVPVWDADEDNSAPTPNEKKDENKIEISCDNDVERDVLFAKLENDGYKCRKL